MVTNTVSTFADTNVDTGEAGGQTGSGTASWKYTTSGKGIRVSVYWAKSEASFSDPRGSVYQVGETKDFAYSNPTYSVDLYAKQSVFDYMNKDGREMSLTYSNVEPYYYIGQENALVRVMPDPLKAEREEWVEFFEGNDYENIPTLTALLGQEVSSEDFISGTYRNGALVLENGHYKLFFEPLVSAEVNGSGMFITLRDFIKLGEKYSMLESMVRKLNLLVEYLANPAYLAFDETALNMIANEYNGSPYQAEYDKNSYTATTEEMIAEMQPGGKIYNSMGVGVVDPQRAMQEEAAVISTYVKIAGVNSDGTLIYDTIHEPEYAVAGYDDKGAVIIEEIKDIDEGTAYLNDVITSPKNLAKTTDNPNTNYVDTVDWTDVLPSNPIVPDDIALNANDIWRYNLGLRTGAAQIIADTKGLIGDYAEVNDLYAQYVDTFSKVGNTSNTSDLLALYNELNNILNFDNPLLDNATADYRLDVVKKAVQGYNDSIYMGFVAEAVFIEDIDDVYIDTQPPSQSVDIIFYRDGGKSGSYIPQKNKTSLQASGLNGVQSTTYLRYIVIPTRQEVIYLDIYRDGVLIDTQRIVDDLPLVEVSEGVYDPNVVMTDMRAVYPTATLLEYGTSTDNPLLDTMPSNPIKSGDSYETITGLASNENVYVHWRVDLASGAASAADTHNVPEWRLSKYVDSLGYTDKAYMGLDLHSSSGHETDKLSPSGAYSYTTINPNGQLSSTGVSKVNDWLHSVAITKGDYKVTLNNPSALVDVSGTATLIKDSNTSGLVLADWVNGELGDYSIVAGNQGTTGFGATSTYAKSSDLTYGISNNSKYIHTYGVYYHPTRTRADGSTYSVCRCYTRSVTATPSYIPADYHIDATFDRYATINTDSKLYQTPDSNNVDNGLTAVNVQSSNVLYIYPEVAMLYADNQGYESIKYVAGDIARQIQPISYHTMDYQVYVKDVEVTGPTVTDVRALNTIVAPNPVYNKGSNVMLAYDVTKSSSDNSQGQLIVKSYTLDIADEELKVAWGNSGYNTASINDTYLGGFGNQVNGKWQFDAQLSSQLYIDSNTDYTGPETRTGATYTESSKNQRNYPIVVRGGGLVSVDGVSIDKLKTTNTELYAALEGMGLIGSSKDNTVFATFEDGVGAQVDEQVFIDMVNAAKGVNNLSIGDGWYSEDTTVLMLTVYTTILDLPKAVFGDRIPMTVSGLETPQNKNLYYSKIANGHSILTYSVSNGSVDSYFTHNTSQASANGARMVSYGVANVSIVDTTFGN